MATTIRLSTIETTIDPMQLSWFEKKEEHSHSIGMAAGRANLCSSLTSYSGWHGGAGCKPANRGFFSRLAAGGGSYTFASSNAADHVLSVQIVGNVRTSDLIATENERKKPLA